MMMIINSQKKSYNQNYDKTKQTDTDKQEIKWMSEEEILVKESLVFSLFFCIHLYSMIEWMNSSNK